MSHNIWNDGTTGAMFCVGDREAAWHKLGQRTPDAVTWERAIELAHLNWEVKLRPAYARNPKGEVVQLPCRGVFRDTDSALLGYVGPDYVPIQNRQAFDWVDSLLAAEAGAHYESAGALGLGERVWCLARVPGADFAVAGVDHHQSYLLFTTAHDGTMSATCKLTTVRVVCQNTLAVALSQNGGTALRIRHTKAAAERMRLAAAVMQGVVKDAEALQGKLNVLAERKVRRESVQAIMDRLFPAPPEGQSQARRDNTVSEVLTIFAGGADGGPRFGGTAYALFNAITQYVDHHRTARITEDRKRAGYLLPQARAENALWGTGNVLKNDALGVILELTKDDGRYVYALPPATSQRIV